MGREWDDPGGPEAFQLQVKAWGEALLPLLYPGALVFMFGGTRMWHRLAAGMEDAGFYLWDTLLWLRGQGFPKGQALDSMIDAALGKKDERKQIGVKEAGIGTGKNHGHHQRENGGPESRIIPVTATATAEGLPWVGHKTCALKPAWEPVLCFRAPDGGATYAELAMKYGSGALNIDGSRIGTEKAGWGGTAVQVCSSGGSFDEAARPTEGRYPANLALECTCEEVEVVDAPREFSEGSKSDGIWSPSTGKPAWPTYGGKAIRHTDPSCPAFQLDEQAGDHPTARIETPCPSPEISGHVWGTVQGNRGPRGFDDSGGPSRFFYCAKASRSEREAGLEGFSRGVAHAQEDAEISTRSNRRCKNCGLTKFSQPHCTCENPQWEETEGSRVANIHPTVKPIDLNHWLATLLLPPDSVKPRRILVPFAGVASEMIGCLVAGWDEVVGVEMSLEYCKIAEARLAHWEPFKDRPEAARRVKVESDAGQASLFGS